MSNRQPAINKITFPVLGQTFPRKRLFRTLDQRRHYKITWISGMAGSGKTTLAASYLKNNDLPSIWYQCDEGDSDPAGFFYYLGKAANKSTKKKGKPLPLFTGEYSLGAAAFARRYFENLSSYLSPDCFLVFDDYHTIPSEAAIHDIFCEGLLRLSDDIHVIIISRKEPPPAFARMLVKNTLRIIDGHKLLMTRSESGKILRAQSHAPVPPEELDYIHFRTKGWAALLVLMAQSIAKGRPMPKTAEIPTSEDIFAYFAGEFFDGLDQDSQNFMIITAFLPKITPVMAQALTGSLDAEKQLASMENDRLLIDKFSTSSDVYQYHPLFREFLISRAQSILGPEEINATMETAGHLLVEAGYIEDAVDLYTRSGQMASLAELIHRYAVELLQQGRFRTIEHWIERIPTDALNDLPWMSFWLGMSRLHAFPAKARTVFEAAFTAFNAQGDVHGVYLSWSGIIESFLYEWNDFTQIDPWIEWFEEHHQDDQIYPLPAIEARITVSMMCALMFRQPDRTDINQWVERSLTLSSKHGDIRLRIEAWDWAVTYYCWLGNFARADIIKQETSHAMQAYQQDPAVMLHMKWLDIAMNIFTSVPDDSVLEQIHEALSTGEKTGIHIWDQMFLTNGIYAALMLGNLPEAKKFIEELDSRLDPARYHANSLYHMGLVIYHMLSDDLPRALEHARRAYSITKDTGYIFPHIICKFALAQVLVEIEEILEAQRELEDVIEMALRTHSFILEFMCQAARSHLALKQGMRDKAYEFLQQAMTIGRKHNFRTMIWWWQPSMMADLLRKALQAGIEIDYVRGMIRAHKVVPDSNAYTTKDWPWVFAIKTLGGFEIRKNDQVLSFNGKAHKKPFELLKILIAFGSRGVPVDKITDELWPEADGDMAHSALTTTLNRLRTILECKEIIEHRDGRLSLNMQICHVDSKAFTGLLEKARSVLEKGDQAEASVFMETALKLYHGHFLEEDNHSKWTISSREQLKDRFIDTAIELGRYLEKQKEYERAISWYRRGTEIDPTNECFYQNRMVCYHNLGQYPEVEKTYLLCRNMLENLLGVYPSQKTMQVYENIRKSQSTPHNPNT